MVNLDDLATRGLHAYEAGRVRMALRALAVLAPICLVSLLESRGRASCGCAAAMLVVLAVVMRWRSRRGVEAVTTGILAGVVPLGAGIIFKCFDLDCEVVSCTIAALLVGGASGAVIGVRSRGAHAVSTGTALGAVSIAALATCMGCIRLGVVGLGAMMAGLAIGLALTKVPARSDAT